MNRREDYIAVFDSGVGGISVLRQLVKQMPGERYLYFGDSANAPYGTRPTEQIRELTLSAAEQLMARGLKALVVACNTATAAAIETLRQTYPNAIIIGIEPALKLAAERFPGGRVGVMATPVTLREEKFSQQLHRFSQSCQVFSISAPGLVELVEADKETGPEAYAMLEPLLSPYAGKLDALVLGCTHYPFAAAAISNILGPGTVLLDGGDGTARETKRRLTAAGLLRSGPGQVIMENSLQSPEILALSMRLLNQDDPI